MKKTRFLPTLVSIIAVTTALLVTLQKAREFLNRTVKITGVLDPTSGMIRISEIGPA